MRPSSISLSLRSPLVLVVMAALTTVVVALLLAGDIAPSREPALLAAAEAAVLRANTPATAAHAPAELRRAHEKLAAAQAAFALGDTASAGQLGELAEIDARVAELHAQTMLSRQASRE